jgi:hypothetical protein
MFLNGLLALVLAGAASGAARADGGGLSVAEFTRLHKELHVKHQPWATVGWKVSVTAARQEAARAHKPIFLVVNTGNCLGFV